MFKACENSSYIIAILRCEYHSIRYAKKVLQPIVLPSLGELFGAFGNGGGGRNVEPNLAKKPKDKISVFIFKEH